MRWLLVVLLASSRFTFMYVCNVLRYRKYVRLGWRMYHVRVI